MQEYQKEFQVLADFTSKELHAELWRRGISINVMDDWYEELERSEHKKYADMEDQDAETNA